MKKVVLALAAASLYATTTLALPVVTYVQQTSLYKPSTVHAAGFNVELYGSPAPGMSGEAAIAGLHGPAWAGGAPLRLLPEGAKPGQGTRLVLVFNGASVPSETACEEPGALGGGQGVAGGSLRVVAIYCSADRMLARGALSADAVTGPGDRAYQSAMQSLLAAMFPPQNTNISPFGPGI
ncbi:hypothetical protein [Parvibaculum sp.]|uniref:hypothetical protein n=1 Tax=Parvibaculum sp. TaxID=2024848 RepID=UPI003210B4F9